MIDNPYTSFNLKIMPGEMVIYGKTTITPPGPIAYALVGNPVEIDAAFTRAWLEQSLDPLVGPEATQSILGLVDGSDLRSNIISQVIAFRKSLAPPAGS
jgi:hypothetical protein